MPFATTAEVDRVRRSKHFDADWYLETYPNIKAMGMAAAEHFANYGASMLRDPSPEFSTAFFVDTHSKAQTTSQLIDMMMGEVANPPKQENVVWAASRLAEQGDYGTALDLLKKYGLIAHAIPKTP